MNPLDLEYALAKQVPDMARGFRISTSYGDIAIEPGWVASIVITHLERALRCELRELNAPTPDVTDKHGFSLACRVIGGSDVRHQASVPAGEAFCAHCSAPLLSQAAALPPAPTQPTHWSHP